jgi:hypothetical protein
MEGLCRRLFPLLHLHANDFRARDDELRKLATPLGVILPMVVCCFEDVGPTHFVHNEWNRKSGSPYLSPAARIVISELLKRSCWGIGQSPRSHRFCSRLSQVSAPSLSRHCPASSAVRILRLAPWVWRP